MSIVRIAKKKRFAVISIDPLEITTLSWKAKGLWSYLMTRPDNWQVSVAHLSKHFPSGKDSIRSGLKELEEHGLCTIEQRRNEAGSFSTLDYTIHEEPIELKKCLPQTENPSPGFSAPANPALINIDNNLILKEDISEQSKPALSPSAHEIFQLLQEKLKQQKPDRKPLSEKSSRIHLNPLVKRISLEEIRKVILWIYESTDKKAEFWKEIIQSAKSFSNNFDKISVQMMSSRPLEDSKEKNKTIEKNKTLSKKLDLWFRDESPKRRNGRIIDAGTSEIIFSSATGQILEQIPYDHAAFEERFNNILIKWKLK